MSHSGKESACCLCPEKFVQGEFKSNRLICQAEDISRQSNSQAESQLLLTTLIQVCSERGRERVGKNTQLVKEISTRN